MKICQITHGRVNPDGENGITRTVYSLNKILNKNGVESEIYSFNDKQTEVENFIRDEFTTVKLFPRSKHFKSKKFCDFILNKRNLKAPCVVISFYCLQKINILALEIPIQIEALGLLISFY